MGLRESSTTPGDPFSRPVNIKWQEGSPSPVSHVAHTAVWLNGLVYVGGGYETGWTASYTISCYDPVNDLWRSPIYIPYCHTALTTLNNNLLIAGGRDKNNKKTDQILTIDNGQLNIFATMTAVRSHARAVGHQGILIIVGGKDDSNEVVSYTEVLDNGRWYFYSGNNLPQPHSHLKSVIVDNTLYLLGGNNKDGQVSPAIFAASLDTLSNHQLNWNTHQDIPWCCSASASVYGKYLLILGGSEDVRNDYKFTSNVYKLNKVNHSWELIGHIPAARNSSAAVSIGYNKVIVIGGVNDKGEYTNTVWNGSFEPQ